LPGGQNGRDNAGEFFDHRLRAGGNASWHYAAFKQGHCSVVQADPQAGPAKVDADVRSSHIDLGLSFSQMCSKSFGTA